MLLNSYKIIKLSKLGEIEIPQNFVHKTNKVQKIMILIGI